MSFPTLQITEAGKAALIKALAGGSLEFSSVKVGNGEVPENAEKLSELQNPLLRLAINSIERGDSCVSIVTTFDNATISAGFHWREIGVFVNDPDDGEVLYAYAHAGDNAEYIPMYSDTSFLKTTINVVVAVGDAENITAILGEYSGYAGKEEFNEHINNTENPHEVTAEQIGLGNVENVSVNDAAPTYTDYPTVVTLQSGEKTSVAFSKIKKAISAFLTHIAASNPHSITTAKIGAAPTSHSHSASDVTSGSLGVTRGGTGGTSAKTGLDNLVGTNWIDCSNGRGIRCKDSSGTLRNLIYLSTGNSISIGGDSVGTEMHLHTGQGMICFSNTDGTTRNYIRMSTAGTFYPTTVHNLGSSGNRWGTVYCTGLNNSSDRKVKENITEIEKAQDIILGLKPIKFNRVGENDYEMGFVAQDVYALFKSIGIENAKIYAAGAEDEDGAAETSDLKDTQIDEMDDKDLSWGLDYTQLIAPLVSVVQKQQQEIERLKEIANRLEAKQ